MFSTTPKGTRNPTATTTIEKGEKPKRDRADYMREFMARKRARTRDITIPAVVDRARRERCLADPALFLRTYWPGKYSFAFTPTQAEVVETVAKSMRHGTRKAIAIPRGDGKTSIVEGLSIWAACAGVLRFIGIVPSTHRMARNILESLKSMLQSEEFAEDFPEVAWPIIKLGGEPRNAGKQTVGGVRTEINWTADYLQLPTVKGSAASGVIIYPASIDGAIRGLKLGIRRPDYIILDDPETAESARSEPQIALRESIINRDIAGLKGQGGRLGIAALVTIQNAICLAARLTDRQQRPDFAGMRRSALLSWPTRLDLWEEYMHRRKSGQELGDDLARDACRFYLANAAAMHEGASVSNPNNFNRDLGDDQKPIQFSALQACFDFICDNGREAFESEYQNNPDSHGDADATRLTVRVIESRINKLDRGASPEGTIGMTAAIDVGKYGGHWVRLAFGTECRVSIESYGVAEVKGVSSLSTAQATERAIVAMLHEWRETELARPTRDERGEVMRNSEGKEMRPVASFVDSGDGNVTEAIYGFVRSIGRTPGVPMAASKGYGEGQRIRRFAAQAKFSNGMQAPRQSGTYWHRDFLPERNLWLWNLDANFWKRFVHARFATAPFDDDRGDQLPYSLTIHRADTLRQHQTFGKHVTAEEWQEKFIPGRGMVRKWVEVSANNHWLDALYMALALGNAANFFKVVDSSILSGSGPNPSRT